MSLAVQAETTGRPARRALIRALACGAFFIYVGSYASSAVFAQRLNPVQEFQPLSRRILPEYEPNGYRVGDFNILPSFTSGIAYDDNIYGSNEFRESDTIYTFSPALAINSDFIRHALNANFSVERGIYEENSGENYTDVTARLSGRLELTGDTTMPLGIGYSRDHYNREIEEERIGLEPTVFDLYTATTGLVHSGQAIAARAIATLERYVFKDIETPTGTVDNSDRNRSDYNLYTSFGAREEAVISPFVYSNIGRVQYDDIDENGSFGDRSASEFELGAGTILNISDITRAMLRAGYITRQPDDDRFSSLSDVGFGMDVIWEPSTLASFLLGANRYFDETITERSGAAIRTDFRLSMNYELSPNIIVTPNVDYRISEYDGIDRETNTIGAGVNVNYKLNQNLWLSSSYRYIKRDEKGDFSQNDGALDGLSDDYDGNTVSLSLKLQF